MTYVKKLNPDWNPQEHPGILVGDVVDFPGVVDKLVAEGNVALCDADGNEISAYDTLGVVTDRELAEFRKFKEEQRQIGLKKSLEAEHDELLAEAAKLKSAQETTTPAEPAPAAGTVEEAKAELEQKKKDFAKRMADAKAAKAAERAAVEATSAEVTA